MRYEHGLILAEGKTKQPRKKLTAVRLFDDQLRRINELVKKSKGRMDYSTFVREAIDEKLKRIEEGLE